MILIYELEKMFFDFMKIFMMIILCFFMAHFMIFFNDFFRPRRPKKIIKNHDFFKKKHRNFI